MSDEISLSKGWSLEAYIAHNESMREAEKDVQAERDRRYAELFKEREKAWMAAVEGATKEAKAEALSAKAAVEKAEVASEKRFEGVNEFRATLADQAATLISRAEVEQQFQSVNEKVDLVTSRMDRLDGRSGGNNQTVLYAVAALGILGTLAGIVGTIVAIVTVFTRS